MKLKSAILGLMVVSTGNWANGQEAASSTQILIPRKLFIYPTSTAVPGGKASLTITALRRKAASYIGEYDLKVSPWSFKNETGKLTVMVTDELVRKLIQGIAVDITGNAITDEDGRSRPVSAKATPSGNGQGSVTFTVTGEERKLNFKTKYHFKDE